MKTTKKALTVMVGVLTATSLVACGKDEQVERNADGEIVVTFWHSTAGAPGETLSALVDEFNEEHEGEIEIRPSYQGNYVDGIAKFVASAGTGQLPAIMQANEAQTNFLIDSGLTVSPEELGDYNFDNLMPTVENYFRVNGKVHSMPAMVSQLALLANTDQLEESGVDPKDVATTEGLLDAAESVKKETGHAGLTFHQNAWYIEQFAAMSGQEICSPDNGVGSDPATQFTIASDQSVDMWNRIGGMFQDGSIHNPGTDGNAALGSFLAGDVAMQLVSSSSLNTVESADKNFDFSVLPLPADTRKAGGVIGGNSLWVIGEGHDRAVQEAAWKFLEYMGSDETQARIFTETGYLPTTKGAVDLLDDLTDNQKVLLKQLVETPQSTVTAGCHTGGLNSARAPYSDALANIMNGGDAKAELESAEDKSNTALKQYNQRAEAQK